MNYLLPIVLSSCLLAASGARAQEEEVLYFDDLEDDELASDSTPILDSNTTVQAGEGQSIAIAWDTLTADAWGAPLDPSIRRP